MGTSKFRINLQNLGILENLEKWKNIGFYDSSQVAG